LLTLLCPEHPLEAELGYSHRLEDIVEHGGAARRRGRGRLLFSRCLREVRGAEHREATSHGGRCDGDAEVAADELEFLDVGTRGEDALAVFDSEVVGEVLGGLLGLDVGDDEDGLTGDGLVEGDEDAISGDLGLVRQGLVGVGYAVLGRVDEVFKKRDGGGLAGSCCSPKLLAGLVGRGKESFALLELMSDIQKSRAKTTEPCTRLPRW